MIFELLASATPPAEVASDSTPWERIILGLVPVLVVLAGTYSKKFTERVTGAPAAPPDPEETPVAPPSPAARTVNDSVDAMERLIVELQASRDELRAELRAMREHERRQDEEIETLQQEKTQLQVEAERMKGQMRALEIELGVVRRGGI